MKPANYPNGNGTRTVDSQHGAFVALSAYQNVMNYFKMVADIYESTAVEMAGQTPSMVSAFTHNADVAAVIAHNARKDAVWLHWEQFAKSTFFGAFGVLAMSTGPVGMAVVAAGQTLTGGALDFAWKPGHNKRDVHKSSRNATADWLATRAQFPIGKAGDDAATVVHHFGGLKAIDSDIAKHMHQWMELQDPGFR